jgi:excisionase family DNA binding protein
MKKTELPPPERRVGVKEAARLLGVHCSCVYRWLSSGRLPAWRIGGRWQLSRDDVLGFPQRCGPGEVRQGGVGALSDAEAAALLRGRGYPV